MTVTVITVLVTPEDAERLILAATQGRIQMALRNTLDLDTLETSGSRVSSLMAPRYRNQPAASSSNVSRPAPTPSPEPMPSVIEIYRGGERSLLSY